MVPWEGVAVFLLAKRILAYFKSILKRHPRSRKAATVDNQKLIENMRGRYAGRK
jgi:hypothetical protein